MNIINLKDIIGSGADKNAVGNKAYNLAILNNIGVPVAEGFVITVDTFIQIVIANNAIDELNNINNINYRNNVAKFRERIKTFHIPTDIFSEIKTKISDFGYPVIVRSSSHNEDSKESSMAGLYLSVGNVREEQELEQAILEVWASAYYNKFTHHEPIAVVIQKYYEAEAGGVIFSQNPIEGENYYGEYSLKGAEQVVDGMDNGEFELTADGDLLCNESILKNQSIKLANYIKIIKEEFKCEVDVEWLITGGN